jgi:hypothetical protein
MTTTIVVPNVDERVSRRICVSTFFLLYYTNIGPSATDIATSPLPPPLASTTTTTMTQRPPTLTTMMDDNDRELGEADDDPKGPNDSRRVVWAPRYFFFLTSYFLIH